MPCSTTPVGGGRQFATWHYRCEATCWSTSRASCSCTASPSTLPRSANLTSSCSSSPHGRPRPERRLCRPRLPLPPSRGWQKYRGVIWSLQGDQEFFCNTHQATKRPCWQCDARRPLKNSPCPKGKSVKILLPDKQRFEDVLTSSNHAIFEVPGGGCPEAVPRRSDMMLCM